MIILSIETSCDETAISVVRANGDDKSASFDILGDSINSQIDIHSEYGGVFPALAKREHSKNIVPVLTLALKDAKMYNKETKVLSNEDIAYYTKLFDRNIDLLDVFISFIPSIKKPNIDALAVTKGPGLAPALWVGVNFAQALAHAWDVPLIPVNHMEGHIFAGLINDETNTINDVKLPILSLLVSGGHTELVLMEDWLHYKKLGGTRDDAVGEAFDKVARVLGLTYPGGPKISKLAEEGRKQNITEPKYPLPRPMLHSKDFDFSFSGIKTAVLYTVKKIENISQEDKIEIALEFENAVTEVLVKKTLKAIENFAPKTLVMGGGVSANKYLRETLKKRVNEEFPDISVHIPKSDMSTDNAVMIALSGFFRQQASINKDEILNAVGNLTLE